MRFVPTVIAAVIALTWHPAGGSALADAECRVRVVRAPDPVRAAIEARIGIEESACTKLDVRVVAVRDGYYVIATAAHGEAYEGNVRDAGLVGELVASWVRLPRSSKEDNEDEDEDEDDDEDDDEGAAVATAEPVTEPNETSELRATLKPTRGKRDLVIGGLINTAGYGMRAEVDIFAGGGFSLGLALGIASSDWSYDAPMSTADLTFRDIRGVVVVAKTFGSGPWRVRAQAGVGRIQTAYTGKLRATFESPVQGEGTTTMFEAALGISHDVGDHWALSIAPLFSYYGQAYEVTNGVVTTTPTRELEVSAFMAVRRRL